MKLQRWTSCAMGLSVALTLSAVESNAQDTSQVRIPVRKGTSTTSATTRTDGSTRVVGGVTQRESGGDVATLTILRIDSLEAVTAEYKTRLDAMEAANAAAIAAANTRNAALEARIGALSDSLATARTELAALKEELNATNTRLTEVDTRLQGLNQRFDRFKNHTLFGNSGFYVGLGTGSSFTSGTLRSIGYRAAPLLTVPIGWHKYGNMLGVRTEWSLNRLEGRQVGSFFNPDPTVASGVAMATLAFPINEAKSHNVYVMGGGGFYMFRNFGATSALADKFSGSVDGDTETKWGFNAGAGAEFHILGATSLFVQTSMTNVAADRGTVGEEGRNLRWMPVVVGFTLR